MAIAEGFTMLTSVFGQTEIFGIGWILGALITIITLMLISRDVQKWNILALPITSILNIIGLRISIIQYIITAIMFIVGAMSIDAIGNPIRTIIRERRENKRLLDKEVSRRKKGILKEQKFPSLKGMKNLFNLK